MIELFSLALTVEALQGKTCQDSLSGGGTSVWAQISGGRGRPWEYFLVSTFCYLTVQTALCYVPSCWYNTGVWQTDMTDGQTDGNAIAITAPRRAVKTVSTIGQYLSLSFIILLYAITFVVNRPKCIYCLNKMFASIFFREYAKRHSKQCKRQQNYFSLTSNNPIPLTNHWVNA